MLTLNFYHSDSITLDEISERLIHEVMKTVDLSDLKHMKVMHKSTRELDVFFKDERNIVLVLNLIGSYYRADVVISGTGDLEDMIKEFTKFTYKFKAHHPFKLTKAKTAELANQVTEDDRNQRIYNVDDYSFDEDYSNTDSQEISFNELTEGIRRSNTTRSVQRTPSPFNKRRQKKKKSENDSPFGSIGKVFSFFIKAIIILGLIRTCSSRFGEDSNQPDNPNTYTTTATVVSITDLPPYLAQGKSADGTSRDNWKMIHYSYSYKGSAFKNQRIMSAKELELLGTDAPELGDLIRVQINPEFPSISTMKTVVVIDDADSDSKITYEFYSSDTEEEMVEME